MNEAKPETTREAAVRIAGLRFSPENLWPTTLMYRPENLVACITAELEKRDRELRDAQLASAMEFDRMKAFREECDTLKEQLAQVSENRDHFCHYLNLIAKEIGTDKDNSAPDAVLRWVKDIKEQLAEAVLRLGQCAETFRIYETMHTAKQTEEGLRKAASNGAYAEGIEQFLARVKGSTTPEPKEMQNVVGRAETITTWMKSFGVNPKWDGEAFEFPWSFRGQRGIAIAHRGDWIVKTDHGFDVRKGSTTGGAS